jgi:ribosome-binding factor A
MKPASQRQLRVGEQIRHILADTLRGGFFYNHNGVAGEFSGGGVIVAEVRPSPDLKQAKVYISTVKPQNSDSSRMRRLPIPPRLMRFYIRSAVRIGNKLFTLIHHSVFIFL